ncbi:MAG: copper amine oxidase N-terminal domain-containing protein [Oscillospiraceae bacterium]
MIRNFKMKNVMATVIAFCITLMSFTVFGVAETIVIDGKTAKIPTQMGSIVEKDSRTFVPLRFVMEYLGCTLAYDDATKSVTIFDKTNVYVIQVDNNKLFKINSKTGENTTITMDTTVILNQTEGRIYLPIRFLAEAIGYTVGWDETVQTVSLIKQK